MEVGQVDKRFVVGTAVAVPVTAPGHFREFLPDDLFDALEVLQFALTGIYDTKQINAKAAKLKAKKPVA